MKNKFWIIVLVLGAFAVTGLIIRNQTGPEATVDVVTATKGQIRAYIEEQAITELPQDYLISMPINGWLTPITLREGDRVEQGKVIAQLDTDDLKDRVQQAENRIAVLESQIKQTKDNRLEDNAMIQITATVTAMKKTVAASEARSDDSCMRLKKPQCAASVPSITRPL